MINLKKLFRRKKGQGALEYLFMIAAALIIIFVVVRYISGSTQQATSQTDIASLQSQAELAKSQLIAKDWWDNDYYVYYDRGNENLIIDVDSTDATEGDEIATIDISNSAYLDDIDTAMSSTSGYVDVDGTSGADTLADLYSACMDDSNEDACKVLAALGGS